MAGSTVYLALAFLLVGALAAPQEETNSIEDLENGYFFSNTRIVGGTPVPPGGSPWSGALSTGTIIRSLLCGCSVVSRWHVLTAAHCIEAVFSRGSLSSSLRVNVDSNRWNSGATQYAISGNITHPHYVSGTIKNDIGILITTNEIQYTPTVQPTSLHWDHVGGGQDVRVAGWGRIRGGGAISPDLLTVDLTTLDGNECVRRVAEHAAANNIRAPAVEPHLEICTFYAVGRGTCNGDSGSALVLRDTNQQVGIVSWGFPCAVGAPDMFARVSGFRSWIEENMSSY